MLQLVSVIPTSWFLNILKEIHTCGYCKNMEHKSQSSLCSTEFPLIKTIISLLAGLYRVAICLSLCRLCTFIILPVLFLSVLQKAYRHQDLAKKKNIVPSSFEAHHMYSLVSNTSWTCNFLFYLETVQYFWPTFWSWCIATFLFPFFPAQQKKKIPLRVSPSWDIYCQFSGLSTPYLPPTSLTVANHRGRRHSVPPLSRGRFTFAQVLLSNRHQMSFLMEGKSDRQLTPSWLFPFQQASSGSVTTQSTDCII